jgi:hypothetical protein
MTTAVCATLNLAYFLTRLASPEAERPPRRIAAFVLALVSFGALIESVILLSAASAHAELDTGSTQWALVRLAPFAAMVCMSALILRRILEDE